MANRTATLYIRIVKNGKSGSASPSTSPRVASNLNTQWSMANLAPRCACRAVTDVKLLQKLRGKDVKMAHCDAPICMLRSRPQLSERRNLSMIGHGLKANGPGKGGEVLCSAFPPEASDVFLTTEMKGEYKVGGQGMKRFKL